MTTPSTHEGYLQTKDKLTRMETRLAELARRSDLDPAHKAEVERSYHEMMRQYRRDLKLYEAAHTELTSARESKG
jgi:hypothetical protein